MDRPVEIYNFFLKIGFQLSYGECLSNKYYNGGDNNLLTNGPHRVAFLKLHNSNGWDIYYDTQIKHIQELIRWDPHTNELCLKKVKQDFKEEYRKYKLEQWQITDM